MLSDFLSYVSEYGILGCVGGPVKEKINEFHAAVNQNDIVVVAQSGCGFCERAKRLLATSLQDRPDITIKLITNPDSVTKAAVSAALNLGDLTFPQIVIHGVYIGGSDDLGNLVDLKRFDTMLAAEPEIAGATVAIKWNPSLLKRSLQPDLLSVPGPPSHFCCFHFYMYSNLVRYMSFFHLALMIICLILASSYPHSNLSSNVISGLLIVLCVDLTGLVLLGPSPYSLSGTAATYFFWKYRGNSTSSLPYKFVFAIYVSVFIGMLVNGNTGRNAIAPLTSTIINSALLAVFRF